MLEVKGVTFAYNGRRVLFDVSLEFPENTFTCIIGQNGSGKTSLLRLLAGIVEAEAGTVTFGVQPGAHHFGCIRDGFSYLPHRPRIIFPFTSYEIVSLGLRRPLLSFNPAIDDEAVREAMFEMDCLSYFDRPITKLSAGEQQRVFIAQAIVSRPKVLLLDEPTASLDIAHQLSLMRKLANWAHKGMIVIAVVHDINLAAAFADRLCLMRGGRIIASGVTHKVFNQDLLFESFGVKGVVENCTPPYWRPVYD